VNGGGERRGAVRFPDDYSAGGGAGKTAEVGVAGKGGRGEEVAGVDDDFAGGGSEVETPHGARGNISDQIRQILDRQIAERFREGALDAAVEKAKVDLPDPVVEARAAEMWRRVERQLQQEGMDPENYLQLQGKTRDQMVEQARPDAERAL